MEIAVELAKLNASLLANIATLDINALSPINGGITEGFEGKVVSIGYNETTLKLTSEQVIKDAAGAVVLTIPVGSNAVSLGLKFEDGSSVALSTLRRSAKSSIGGKSTRAMSAADYAALVNQTIKAVAIAKDASTETMRNVTRDGVTTQVPNVGKSYQFAIK